MQSFKNISQLYKMKLQLLFIALLGVINLNVTAQKLKNQIITGADRMETYLPLLKGKKVAVFANQTSTVGGLHLVDTLVKRGINVVKIFGPEHGFRGTADAGEHVVDGLDIKSGLPVISLYGNH